MTSIEEEYKNRFQNQQLTGEGLDVEGLWDEISEDLKEESPKRDNGKNLIWLLLLFIGIGLGSMVVWISNTSKIAENNLSEGNSEVANKAVAIEKIIDSPTESSFFQDQELSNSTDKESSLIDKTNSTKVETTQSLILKNKTNDLSLHDLGNPKIKKASSEINKMTENLWSENNSLNKNQIKASQNESNKISDIKVSNETRLNDEVQTINEINASTKSIDANRLSISTFDLIKGKSGFLESRNYYPLVLKHQTGPYTKSGKGKSIVWKISVYGGLNTKRFRFDSQTTQDLASLKNETEKRTWGYSGGVNSTLLLKNRWLLKSGLEYTEVWNKFEYLELKNIQVLEENQLLKIWLDSDTNDTLNVRYGDTLVNASSERHVVHYNRYQQFSIPIEVGIQQNWNKLTYGVSTGLLLNFMSSQSGKTINKDFEIVLFDQENDIAPFKPFNIGFRVSPFLEYSLNKKLFASFSPQFSWQTNSNLGETDLRLNTLQLNLNVGIGYYFK